MLELLPAGLRARGAAAACCRASCSPRCSPTTAGLAVGAVTAAGPLYAAPGRSVTDAGRRRDPSTGLTKRFRPAGRGRRHRPAVPRGAVYGFLGPERLGQDHHDPDAARPGPAHRRADRAARRSRCPRVPARVLPRVGALVEGPAFHPYLSGRANLRRLDAADRTADPRTAGARIDAALDRVGLLRRGDQALPRLLARHAAAARHRRGAARAARAAGPGRADQRPRPAGHPRGAAPDRDSLADEGATVLRLHPPALRGRADLHATSA